MARMVLVLAAAAAFLLVGCSDPKNTKVPPISKMDSIKPELDKLKPEERELFTAYVLRTSFASAFGKGDTATPADVTIGQAVEQQRQWVAEAKAREEAEKALRAKFKAQKEAAEAAMRDAVSVTLVRKKLNVEHGYSGMVMDEKLVVEFGYQNNTDKDIAGVKGLVTAVDLFGDEISGFQVSNDETIKAHGTKTWTGSRSVKYSFGSNKDRKLAELSDDKFKIKWEPQAIVFADGTVMKAPTEQAHN